MGRAEIQKVSSLLRQVLIHLLKMAVMPESPSRAHFWKKPSRSRQTPNWHSCPG